MEARKGSIFTVPILDQIFGSQIGVLDRALGRASERHALLSANLANASNPGYRRRDIGFDLAMDDAGSALSAKSPTLRGATFLASQNAGGGDVDLEKEVVAMAETELRYQVLSDLAGRYFSGLKNVIREGR